MYLDTCFLYYKGTLAFIFEHMMAQEIFCNKLLQSRRTDNKVFQALPMDNEHPHFVPQKSRQKSKDYILQNAVLFPTMYLSDFIFYYTLQPP